MNRLFVIFICLAAFLQGQGQTTPTIGYTYDANGNRISRYVVTVWSSSSAFKGELAAQIGDSTQTIAIYPNPTQGIFAIGVTGLDATQENYYRLYDLRGKLLKHERITADRTSVDIGGNGAGIYLLDVSLGGKITRWKIIKQ
jgi:hypothetical protein